MDFLQSFRPKMVEPSRALPGRTTPMMVAPTHLVLGSEMAMAVTQPLEEAIFGMGCFWGAERIFWTLPGVVVTAVGYAGGFTENPSYEEVCSGRTGHAEVVRVIFDPSKIAYRELLKAFFEGHDPTQTMRQGNDIGTQYRSIIIATGEVQERVAREVADAYEERLRDARYGTLATEIVASTTLQTSPGFFFAEDYHQQYLAKNPNGYCGLGGTGVSCPVGLSNV